MQRHLRSSSFTVSAFPNLFQSEQSIEGSTARNELRQKLLVRYPSATRTLSSDGNKVERWHPNIATVWNEIISGIREKS